MNIESLILYGIINVAMVFSALRKNGGFNQYPFWAGIISLGWFFPQAIGGYLNPELFPDQSYSASMLFASSCSIALWAGFNLSVVKASADTFWLGWPFDRNRLYWSGVALCVFGFYFQWKLWSLPEEMLAQSQWSGATVKYLFFASIFKIGFLTLWFLYLSQERVYSAKLLVYIVPCLLLLLSAAFIRGRRAEMMNVVAYLVVGLWFVRRITLPRWLIISGIMIGIILINAIGMYRSIMKQKDVPLKERISEAMGADYISSSKRAADESGSEFKNYVIYRKACAETGFYDYGLNHWNRLIFNFVPAQIVGRELKESLMLIPPEEHDLKFIAEQRYGHAFKTGSTKTGYFDAFGSFGWFGGIKFFVIGWMMGVLYRYAMSGKFLAQLLYVYTLGTAMHAITHGTHRILFSVWVHFFMLGFPMLYWAKIRKRAV